ncbi:MAG: hypothetical protein BWK79_08365, partial [Beggiatoa sp. IS2]
SESFWFRSLFKIKLYEASGESFQRLFQDIMSYRCPDFQSVAPYQGDGGNDGWIPGEKRYFQVYGKKADSEQNLPYILKKAREDFEKLKNHWGMIERYHFVYNDRFEGAPAPIGQTLLKLQKAHNLIEANVWVGAKLEQLFTELSRDQKEAILHSVPADLPEFIDSRAVGEILSYLADKVSNFSDLLTQTAPDFDEKIKINGLAGPVPNFLRSDSYQTQDVDDFLQRRDFGLKQAISEEMRALYQESCAKIPDREVKCGNLRYVWMVEQLIPPKTKEHPHTFKVYRGAARVVLAKYFEACDIYEHPSTITTPQTYSLF